VVGIVASRLSEKYSCPSFMIHLQNGKGKGSCRSYGGFNLFTALESCSDLLADFARERGACALVKGARSGTDFDWEYQMAQINRELAPLLDTVLLPARPCYVHISSTMVREMIRYGRRLDACVPKGAADVICRIREGKVR